MVLNLYEAVQNIEFKIFLSTFRRSGSELNDHKCNGIRGMNSFRLILE
jgi:hypothetical protein